MIELLNPGFGGWDRPETCGQESRIFETGDGGAVLYDCNSMSAVKFDSLGQARTVAGQGRAWLSCSAPARPPAPSAPRALTLIATNRCNLNCRYCYAKGRDAADMSVETALAAAKLLDPKAKSWQVNWFGGEPLMNWDVVMTASQEIRKAAPCPVHLGITTNGTLLTRGLADLMSLMNMQIIISLDGCGHDEARSESETAVLSGVEAVDRPGMVTLRATFDRAPSFLVMRLHRLNEVGRGCAVAVEPALCGDGCPLPREVQSEYREASQWFVDGIRAGFWPRFSHYEKLLARLLKREPGLTECGAGASYLAVAPDGAIWPCHLMRGEAIGHVARGLNESARGWLKNAVHDQPGCMSCWARFLCGGGCRLTRCGVSCAYMRMMAAEVIWIAAQLTKAERRAFLER